MYVVCIFYTVFTSELLGGTPSKFSDSPYNVKTYIKHKQYTVPSKFAPNVDTLK